jgi:hypothetical protein
MWKKIKTVLVAALVAGIILVFAYMFITGKMPSEAKREIAHTNEIITDAETRTDGFTEEIQEHRRQVTERTVIIREKVQADIGALDADGLARAAIYEIELWRGGSGDNPSARPPGMDG